MADRLVVGIFPTCDPSALQQALSAQSTIDPTRLRILTNDDRTKNHEDSGLHFVHVIQEERELERDERLTHDTGIISDFGGTDVPGINWSVPLSTFFTGESEHLMSTLGIPDDEAENFSDAIDAGRCVVVYNAGEDTDSAIVALRGAGVSNVHAVT